jgi:hypothetical protein
MELMHFALILPARISSARALQHLKEGFNRRILMMAASLRFIHDTAAKQGGKSISPYTATDLAIHVNALYSNLCGALDNLAWALQHEKQLFPSITETSKRRQQVDLFDTRFLAALAASSSELAATLRGHTAWHSDLRLLRDPAAHRIPIYAVPGVMTEAQGKKFEELNAAAEKLIVAGDHDGGMELIFQSSNLGTYQPLLSLSHEDRFERREMTTQVIQDDEQFTQVAEPVMRFLFADPNEGVRPE